MNVSGVAHGQMVGSYIHYIYFSLTAIGKLGGSRGFLVVLEGSPGANGGQFYQEKAMSTASIFL